MSSLFLSSRRAIIPHPDLLSRYWISSFFLWIIGWRPSGKSLICILEWILSGQNRMWFMIQSDWFSFQKGTIWPINGLTPGKSDVSNLCNGIFAPSRVTADLVFCWGGTAGLIHCNPMRFDTRLGQTVCVDVATPNLYEDVLCSASGLKLLSDKSTALRQHLSFWISLRYDVAFLLFFRHIPHLPALCCNRAQFWIG